MAKYKRRPKVKRYRRSFYSRGMRIRKIVGIVVLVAVVLAAAWFAAPHVLDWATHTWYTVVKDRDLEAESASRAAASSQAAASAAASEAASSAASEPEADVFDGKAIVSGRWAELDTAALHVKGLLGRQVSPRVLIWDGQGKGPVPREQGRSQYPAFRLVEPGQGQVHRTP